MRTMGSAKLVVDMAYSSTFTGWSDVLPMVSALTFEAARKAAEQPRRDCPS